MALLFLLIFKALVVTIETNFELDFTATEVMVGAVMGCLCCFMHNALFPELSFQRGVGFDSPVARWYGVAKVGFIFQHGLLC